MSLADSATPISTTNIGGLVAAASAAQGLAGLVLAIPGDYQPFNTIGYQPLNGLNVNGQVETGQTLQSPLLFHYEGENSVSIQSDITDHYIETNSTVVDQIGLKPEEITVTGYIGELNNVLPAILQPLQTVVNTLQLVDAYTPSLSTTALEDYNEAFFLYQAASTVKNSATSVWASLIGVSGENLASSGNYTVGAATVQNKQQAMFQQLYGYWYNRTLFNIATPWAIFTNMAIKTLRPSQGEETRMISSFEVTFKKIRVASTFLTTVIALASGRAAEASAGTTNTGTQSGSPGTSQGAAISGVK